MEMECLDDTIAVNFDEQNTVPYSAVVVFFSNQFWLRLAMVVRWFRVFQHDSVRLVD